MIWPGPHTLPGSMTLPRVQARHLGQPVHDTFHRELRLVGSEPSKCTANGVVGADGYRLHIDVGHDVWPGGMPGGTLENFHPHRCVSPGVTDHPGPECCELARLVASCPDLDPDRVAFGVKVE